MGDYDHALIAEAEKQTRLLEQLLAKVKCLTERVESVERAIAESAEKISVRVSGYM